MKFVLYFRKFLCLFQGIKISRSSATLLILLGRMIQPQTRENLGQDARSSPKETMNTGVAKPAQKIAKFAVSQTISSTVEKQSTLMLTSMRPEASSSWEKTENTPNRSMQTQRHVPLGQSSWDDFEERSQSERSKDEQGSFNSANADVKYGSVESFTQLTMSVPSKPKPTREQGLQPRSPTRPAAAYPVANVVPDQKLDARSSPKETMNKGVGKPAQNIDFCSVSQTLSTTVGKQGTSKPQPPNEVYISPMIHPVDANSYSDVEMDPKESPNQEKAEYTPTQSTQLQKRVPLGQSNWDDIGERRQQSEPSKSTTVESYLKWMTDEIKRLESVNSTLRNENIQQKKTSAPVSRSPAQSEIFVIQKTSSQTASSSGGHESETDLKVLVGIPQVWLKTHGNIDEKRMVHPKVPSNQIKAKHTPTQRTQTKKRVPSGQSSRGNIGERRQQSEPSKKTSAPLSRSPPAQSGVCVIQKTSSRSVCSSDGVESETDIKVLVSMPKENPVERSETVKKKDEGLRLRRDQTNRTHIDSSMAGTTLAMQGFLDSIMANQSPTVLFIVIAIVVAVFGLILGKIF